jgi:hypothetical protein
MRMILAAAVLAALVLPASAEQDYPYGRFTPLRLTKRGFLPFSGDA